MTELDRRRKRTRRKEWRRCKAMEGLIALGVVAIVAGLPLLIWRGPQIFDSKYLDDEKLAEGSATLATGLRTAVVAVVAALGAGVALLYTARTYRLTRRGQITDRFTKALERLGSDAQYVRIGGILALEQIVKDAPEQVATDAARVLNHFIRDRAPRTGVRPHTVRIPDHPEASITVPLPAEPEADVQAALTALTRPESRTHVDRRIDLDLHELHLAGVKLDGADLTKADLRGATLTKASLSKATLTGAVLCGATLEGADLSMAILARAVVSTANLTKAFLYRVTLEKADAARATLTGVDLSEATLVEASLVGAKLEGADLSGAVLDRTKLEGANLSGAKLVKANLSGATLVGASLIGAKLTDANLQAKQVVAAQVDEATLMPAGLYPSVTPACRHESSRVPASPLKTSELRNR
ncbi:pentapeptide repeat-containing protein [Streptomyces sp. NPDC000618]|uniref:pentapeptide repeat-containing protein n=1 Tax=Streptomyces sp. NPDC000618 TaxID=3154265 RepID=UPI003321D9F3